MNASFVGYQAELSDDWFDVCEHIDTRRFEVALEAAQSRFLDALGLGLNYTKLNDHSFTAFQRSSRFFTPRERGQQVTINCWLTAVTADKIYTIYDLIQAPGDFRLATSEQVYVHICNVTRKTAEIPRQIGERLRDGIQASPIRLHHPNFPIHNRGLT